MSCTGAWPNIATCFFTLGSLVTLVLGVGSTWTVAVAGFAVDWVVRDCEGACVGDPGVFAEVHTGSEVGAGGVPRAWDGMMYVIFVLFEYWFATGDCSRSI